MERFAFPRFKSIVLDLAIRFYLGSCHELSNKFCALSMPLLVYPFALETVYEDNILVHIYSSFGCSSIALSFAHISNGLIIELSIIQSPHSPNDIVTSSPFY
jgi:hypothetical protein